MVFKVLLHYHLFMLCVWQGACVRSEDSLSWSVFSFHRVGPRDWTQVSGLAAGSLTY